VVIINKRHQFDSGLFWSILGHLLGLVKEKDCQQMIHRKKSVKLIPGQSSNAITFSQVERKLTLV
jgi:hypothetical protein